MLEKAAANISVVAGVLSPERAKAMSSRGREAIDPAGGQAYSAAAMSLVFHSAHPHIPTLRADVRLFEVRACRSACPGWVRAAQAEAACAAGRTACGVCRAAGSCAGKASHCCSGAHALRQHRAASSLAPCIPSPRIRLT